MSDVKIFYLYAHEVIGEHDKDDGAGWVIKNAFSIIRLPQKAPDGQGLIFLPVLNEITDITIANRDLFPTRPPLEEEKQIYDAYMRERSPITAGVDAEAFARMKKLHDEGMLK